MDTKPLLINTLDKSVQLYKNNFQLILYETRASIYNYTVKSGNSLNIPITLNSKESTLKYMALINRSIFPNITSNFLPLSLKDFRSNTLVDLSYISTLTIIFLLGAISVLFRDGPEDGFMDNTPINHSIFDDLNQKSINLLDLEYYKGENLDNDNHIDYNNLNNNLDNAHIIDQELEKEIITRNAISDNIVAVFNNNKIQSVEYQKPLLTVEALEEPVSHKNLKEDSVVLDNNLLDEPLKSNNVSNVEPEIEQIHMEPISKINHVYVDAETQIPESNYSKEERDQIEADFKEADRLTERLKILGKMLEETPAIYKPYAKPISELPESIESTSSTKSDTTQNISYKKDDN